MRNEKEFKPGLDRWHFNISRPGPSAQREIINLIIALLVVIHT